ncbi:MAG: hypothetical protein DMG65_07190 [Candidatus Angelobacter sp. Gp1-AA117]|nr:MAG: hypothetical protein DMG65_07190 [Candidatus Angelobacter sp. Gp1-AA117]
MLTLLVVPSFALASFAQDSSKYPLTLKFIQTTSSTAASANAQTQTNCTPVPGTQQINCNSRQTGGGPHTMLTSTVEASDGNTYEVMCIQGAGARFLAGGADAVRAQSGLPIYSGCQMQPGTYQARWDKGRLKVLLYDPKGKHKEVTFAILASSQTVTKTNSVVTQSNCADKSTSQTLSSPTTVKDAYIGTIRLELGIPRRVVESELAKYYRVTPIGSNGDSVYDANNDLGMVVFNADKLSAIISVFYSKEVGDKDFSEILYSTVSSFVHDTGNDCKILSIPHQSQDNIQMKGLVFACGDRKMRLMIVTDSAGTKTLTLSEAVSENP